MIPPRYLSRLPLGLLAFGLLHCSSDSTGGNAPNGSGGADAAGTNASGGAAGYLSRDARSDVEHETGGVSNAGGASNAGGGGAARDAGTDAPSEAAAACTPHVRKFVVNAIRMPLQRSDYAIDLNGDGKLDNQLGNILGALSANNVDVQGTMDAAIASGDALLLLDETSSDPAFVLDRSCARAGLQKALPHPNPFGDAGTIFTPDSTSQRGDFAGTISNAAFASTEPATMTAPVELDIDLSLFALVPVHVVGAHVSFTVSGGIVTGGMLQGVIRKADFDANVAPTMAIEANAAVQSDPSSQRSQQMLAIFDVGGCLATDKNFDGSTAVANDGKIAACEFLGNAIMKNVLSPDVQMFDSGGSYHPNPANTARDSLSLAIGFTAVPAR